MAVWRGSGGEGNLRERRGRDPIPHICPPRAHNPHLTAEGRSGEGPGNAAFEQHTPAKEGKKHHLRSFNPFPSIPRLFCAPSSGWQRPAATRDHVPLAPSAPARLTMPALARPPATVPCAGLQQHPSTSLHYSSSVRRSPSR